MSPWYWRCLLAVVALCATLCAHAAPEIGWWWNPAESGRGFFVESDGGITYIAGYLYADDGRALWLAAGSANADPYNFNGRLLEYAGGQTLLGDYVPPGAPVDRGAVSVHFSDDQHGTLTWPGGVVQIQREIFGTGTPDLPVFSGWWWAPDESGRGYSVEMQGNNLFIVGFMYDDAGKAVWYYSAGPMSSPSTYAGPWYQFANGQTLTGPYQPPSAPVSVANLAITFDAVDQATFTFSDLGSSESAQMKRGHTKIIVPEFTKCTPPLAKFPSRYDGTLTETVTDTLTMGLVTATYTAKITSNIAFTLSTLVTPSPFGNDKCNQPIKAYRYQATGGTIDVDFKVHTDAGAIGQCDLTAKPSFTVGTDIDLSSLGTLTMGSYGRYALDFNVPDPMLPFDASGTCEIGGFTVPKTEHVNYLAIVMGHNEYAAIYGLHGGGTVRNGPLTRTFHWDIASVK